MRQWLYRPSSKFQQLSVHELDEPQDWIEINVVDKDERCYRAYLKIIIIIM